MIYMTITYHTVYVQSIGDCNTTAMLVCIHLGNMLSWPAESKTHEASLCMQRPTTTDLKVGPDQLHDAGSAAIR